MDDAIIGTNKDGKIQRINDAAEAITGWPAEAALGRTLAEVFEINGRAAGLHRLGSVLMTRDRRPIEIEGRAEGVRNSLGALQEILVHFSRRDGETIPFPNAEASGEPLDAA